MIGIFGQRCSMDFTGLFWVALFDNARSMYGRGIQGGKERHMMFYLHRSLSAKEPCNYWLFSGKKPANYGVVCMFATLYPLIHGYPPALYRVAKTHRMP